MKIVIAYFTIPLFDFPLKQSPPLSLHFLVLPVVSIQYTTINFLSHVTLFCNIEIVIT